MSETNVLSASKLGTLSKCSLLYYFQYILKLRNPDNDGSRRGSIVHIIFECLSNKRHKKHYNNIIKNNSAFSSKAIYRLINKLANKFKLGQIDNKGNDNFAMIDSMILLGLSLDFYNKNGLLHAVELAFDYEGEGYNMRGVIDKVVKYPKNKYVLMDYKSSSSKYEGEELNFNIQSLMYCLYFYKTKGIIPFFKFLFLRFKDDPFIEKTYTEEDLLGFEQYLIYITDSLKDYTFQKACGNLAANKGYPKDGTFSGLMVCGRGTHIGQKKKDGNLLWQCSLKHPKPIYCIKDKQGELKYSTDNKEDIKLSDGDYFEIFNYSGCPAFYKENYIGTVFGYK